MTTWSVQGERLLLKRRDNNPSLLRSTNAALIAVANIPAQESAM